MPPGRGDGWSSSADRLLGGPDSVPPTGSVRSRRVVIPVAPPCTWAHHNLRVLARVPDLRLGEVVAVRVCDPSVHWWGRFTLAGPPSGHPAGDHLLADIWADMVHLLGELPWEYVDVLIGDHSWPRGVSFPGAVLLSAELLDRQPRAMRYVYLVHELVHQWFGNLALLPQEEREACESRVDALAWKLAGDRLPRRAAPAFQQLFDRYEQGNQGYEQRGAEAKAYHGLLQEDGLVHTLRQRLDVLRENLDANGFREPIAMLP